MVMISRRLRNRRRSRVGGRPEEASPFVDAIENKNIEQIEEILNNNHKAVFEENENGATPLHTAFWVNLDNEIFAKILKANPEAAAKKDNKGNYPMHYITDYAQGQAESFNQALNAKLLYNAYGKSVWAKNNNKETAMQIADEWGDPILITLLSAAGIHSNGDRGDLNTILKETAQQLIELAESSSLPQPSADQDSNCASWAESGECEKNPDYMLSACAASCNSSANGKKGGKRSRRRSFRKL